MPTPNNRALVEALKLYQPQMKAVLPFNLRNHLDQFFDIADKVSWDDKPAEDGSLKIDPRHLKPTVYTGRMRWFTKLIRWKGDSKAEYEEKSLQQEVLVLVDNIWYQEWVNVHAVVDCEEREGDPTSNPLVNADLGKVEEHIVANAWTGGACSLCGEPQFNTYSGVTCSNGHGGAPAVEGSMDEPEMDGPMQFK